MGSQTSAILSDLRAGRSLTPIDALRLYGSSRLAARISEAKEQLGPDEEIVAVRWRTPSGKTVARYFWRRKEPAQVTLPW